MSNFGVAAHRLSGASHRYGSYRNGHSLWGPRSRSISSKNELGTPWAIPFPDKTFKWNGTGDARNQLLWVNAVRQTRLTVYLAKTS